MTRRSVACMILVLCASVPMAGCMPTMTIEEMKAKMPERPVELDRLDAFVGEWESEGDAKTSMLDEVLKTSGSHDYAWEGNRWYLVGRTSFSMGELGDMEGLETWSYDAKSKKYRTTWTDSMGSVGTGTSRYNEKTGVWHMKAASHGPFGKTTGRGQMKFLDDNTMEWNWTEYMMGGLMKTMEMTGTSRRK